MAGRKIEAIKLYREGAGVGLKEAKEQIEIIIKDLRENKPEIFEQKAQSGGCVGAVLELFALLGCVVLVLWL